MWHPETTYVLIASVTQWPAKAGLAPFTAELRRDEDLAEQFKASGVPGANLVFLKDRAATRAAIQTALAALATRAGEGSTLVLYLQGHGARKVFCSYDSDPENPTQTQLNVDEIYPILDRTWKGERLFLIGDFCSSGSLASVVRKYERLRPDVRAACLASATATNLSTERWTFTAGLIQILSGDARVDRDHDGKITFAEAGTYLLERMKFQENQLASVTATPSFERDFVFRHVAPDQKPVPRLAGPHQIGDVIDAQDSQGLWYASEILAFDEAKGRYRVHFYGWDSKWDEWLSPDRIRALAKPKLTVGQRYQVKWQDGKWYPGIITKAADDWFYFVHYEGEAGEDDEWVTAERTRPSSGAATAARPQLAPVGPARGLAVGDVVAAQWRREWYRARIVGSDGVKFAVVYDDETKGRLTREELIPVAPATGVRPGARVLACWDGKPQMYPGTVASVADAKATIRWDDGSAPSSVPLAAIALIAP